MIIRLFWAISIAMITLNLILYQSHHYLADTLFWIIFPLVALGIYDLIQTKNNILRNYPVIGHLRYLLLEIRPQIQQYFIETNTNGAPFSRQERDGLCTCSRPIRCIAAWNTKRCSWAWI